MLLMLGTLLELNEKHVNSSTSLFATYFCVIIVDVVNLIVDVAINVFLKFEQKSILNYVALFFIYAIFVAVNLAVNVYGQFYFKLIENILKYVTAIYSIFFL